MDYEDLEFDEEKYYLGRLCKRVHDWNGTGASLRYISGAECCKCTIARSKKAYDKAGRKPCPNCGKLIHSSSVFCSPCTSKLFKWQLGKRSPKKGRVHTDPKKRADFLVEHTCEFCGEVFKRDKYKSPRFCSRQCSSESQKKRVILKCKYCGVEFETPISRKGRSKYCSKKCSVAALITLPEIRCLSCEKLFHPKDKTVNYCSRKCYLERSKSVEQCAYCGNTLIRNNCMVKGLCFCDRQCAGKYKNKHRPKILLKCPGCGNYFWTWKSKPALTCNKSCADRMRFVTNSRNNRPPLRGLSVPERRVYGRKECYYKRKYWKGVIELINRPEASDMVVVLAMEKMDYLINFQIDLTRLYREKRWKEYLMKVNQMIEEHGQHLSSLLSGESKEPAFLRRSINRAANTHLGVLREKRKEVVVNAFNHPDEIPTLIEL